MDLGFKMFFYLSLHLDHEALALILLIQRVGGVVERGGLETRCPLGDRGFESLTLCKLSSKFDYTP